MTDPDFSKFYRQRFFKELKQPPYKAAEFVNPHNPLWPQQSFDYPYGQAPEVDDLPPEELADWEKYVAPHYLDAATGYGTSDASASQVAQYGIESLTSSGYPMLDDTLFLEMLCEGLFSKLLCPLDDVDYDRFPQLRRRDPRWDPYLKIDLSCMQVVQPYDGEYVAPTVAIVYRSGSLANWEYHYQPLGYQLVGIDIWKKDRGADGKAMMLPLDPADAEIWRRAKYFVLQGCLHRLLLIDHVRVHFPHDTINAITKSVLPRWHPLHQLLMPHFWLTLPVNFSVLEGDRSLINRDTWYPWSPFAAKGDVIRKLMPFSWAGSSYYSSTPNTAYPKYSFSYEKVGPYETEPLETAASYPSVYRRQLRDLYTRIFMFVESVLSLSLPPPPSDPSQADIVWLEIRRWAHEIARFLPGFPDDVGICDFNTLCGTVATVIWNASAVHSYDHGALHTMMNDPARPMPFVMRAKFDDPPETIGAALAALGPHGAASKTLRPLTDLLAPPIDFVLRALQKKAQEKGKTVSATVALLQLGLGFRQIPPENTPLASPADVLFGLMADRLFFQPHNSSLLFDCNYAFLPGHPDLFPARFTLPNRDKLAGAGVQAFQNGLKDFDAGCTTKYPPDVSAKFGRPSVWPPDSLTDDDKQAFRVSSCIAAGIQF